MPVSRSLIDMLACPRCKSPIELNRTNNGLICRTCSFLYPIRDDIPVMLVDEAMPVKPELS